MAWSDEARKKSAEVRALKKRLKAALSTRRLTTPTQYTTPKLLMKSVASKAFKDALIPEVRARADKEAVVSTMQKKKFGDRAVEAWHAAAEKDKALERWQLDIAAGRYDPDDDGASDVDPQKKKFWMDQSAGVAMAIQGLRDGVQKWAEGRGGDIKGIADTGRDIIGSAKLYGWEEDKGDLLKAITAVGDLAKFEVAKPPRRTKTAVAAEKRDRTRVARVRAARAEALGGKRPKGLDISSWKVMKYHSARAHEAALVGDLDVVNAQMDAVFKQFSITYGYGDALNPAVAVEWPELHRTNVALDRYTQQLNLLAVSRRKQKKV
jgi:hypothetical protein